MDLNSIEAPFFIELRGIRPYLALHKELDQSIIVLARMISSQNLVMAPLFIDGHVRNLMRFHWHETHNIMRTDQGSRVERTAGNRRVWGYCRATVYFIECEGRIQDINFVRNHSCNH